MRTLRRAIRPPLGDVRRTRLLVLPGRRAVVSDRTEAQRARPGRHHERVCGGRSRSQGAHSIARTRRPWCCRAVAAVVVALFDAERDVAIWPRLDPQDDERAAIALVLHLWPVCRGLWGHRGSFLAGFLDVAPIHAARDEREHAAAGRAMLRERLLSRWLYRRVDGVNGCARRLDHFPAALALLLRAPALVLGLSPFDHLRHAGAERLERTREPTVFENPDQNWCVHVRALTGPIAKQP
mmetsp:Transcript_57053/g.169618  ORF Transcript_57053/g.169618 Transcript_57053/m.169618 type:complete len:239 (-) Transcript_57053:221-937(-)